MNKNVPKMNTYTSSSSYTTFPSVYERSAPVVDTNSFYPPLITETSNQITNSNQTLLKKQEQEIKSQLSPSFWDRLNEATKRANSTTNLYDYNSYSNYQILNTVNKSPPTMTNMSYSNGFKNQDMVNKSSYDLTPSSNRISNIYQFKTNEKPISNLSQSTRTLTNGDSGYKVLQERVTPRVSTIEKSQTFAERIETAQNRPTEDNLVNYLKNIPLNRPSQRTLTQQTTQPPPQPKPPSPVNKTVLLVNNKPSTLQVNLTPKEKSEDLPLYVTLGKRTSASSTSLNTIENKLPSAMSSGNIPQIKQETVRRSKTMTLADKEKYLKSIGVNINQYSNSNSSNNVLNNKGALLSSSGSRTFHKSLSIRSRVNNFYKDFVDEMNGYLSNLTRTNSELNLNNTESSSKTPPRTPDQVNENGSKTPEDNKNDYENNLRESKSELNLNSNGVSFTTGETGYFPSKNVERVAESETWKLHKSHLLVGSPSSNNLAKQNQLQSNTVQPNVQATNGQFLTTLDKRSSFQGSDTRINTNAFYYSENSTMQKRFQSFPHRSMQSQGTLRFFFARHGERIDLAFGPQWIEQAFDRAGKYRRVNLNMPTDLPLRPSKREFLGDSPLTEVGQFQARLTGEALGFEGYKIHYCYASPALRCIQTAHQILTAQGLEKLVKIRIEPSVFEFLGWYDKGLPTFINPESLVSFGYNIDVNYKPLLPLDRLQQDENYTDYYQRSFNVTKYLTNTHQSEGANILVIGHAGTLEVCTRQITGMPVRPYAEFNATIRKVPYLGLAMLEKESANSSFEIQGSVIPSLGHTANFNFDPMSLKL